MDKILAKIRNVGALIGQRISCLSRDLSVLRDRRGAAAAMLAVTSITFLAFVGLGTETGAWYLAKRNGQNAADATATSSAVNIYGSASATAQSICTTGGCNGCGSATFKTPAQSSQENWRL